jgi:hypothetical protein
MLPARANWRLGGFFDSISYKNKKRSPKAKTLQ